MISEDYHAGKPTIRVEFEVDGAPGGPFQYLEESGIDTGFSGSLTVPEQTGQQLSALGLEHVDASATVADDRIVPCPLFLGRITRYIASDGTELPLDPPVDALCLSLGSDFLLGREGLESLIATLDGPAQRLMLSQ